LFVALIGVEHRSLAVEVVDSELEIAGRFGSGTVFAEKQVVAAGFAWTLFHLPYVPFGCLEVAGEQGGPGSPDGLGYCAKSRERRFFLRA
jgi:hypothetical protein